MGPLRSPRSTFFNRFSSASRSFSSRRCSKPSMLIIPPTFGPSSLWPVANLLGPRLPLYRGSGWRRIGQKVDQGGRNSRARASVFCAATSSSRQLPNSSGTFGPEDVRWPGGSPALTGEQQGPSLRDGERWLRRRRGDLRSVGGDLLADKVVAHGPGGWKLDERGIPAHHLRLLEQLSQQARREFRVEGERPLRQGVCELRGVVAARGGYRDQASLPHHAV